MQNAVAKELSIETAREAVLGFLHGAGRHHPNNLGNVLLYMPREWREGRSGFFDEPYPSKMVTVTWEAILTLVSEGKAKIVPYTASDGCHVTISIGSGDSTSEPHGHWEIGIAIA